MRKAMLIALAATAGLAGIDDAAAGPRAGTRRETAPENDYFQQYVTGPGGQRIPLRDYPGSATVVTRKMMDDFQANNLCDALRFAPGAIASGC